MDNGTISTASMPVDCPQCGVNGLPLTAAGTAPAVLICEPGSATPVSCALNGRWAAWKNMSGSNGPRTDLFRYIIKSALEAGFEVVDPITGAIDTGMFGMAPNTATTPWTPDDRELVTASMALLTNSTIGVDICLATAGVDTCPPSAYTFLELQAVGDLFTGQGRMLIGSPWAPDPQMNNRTCSAGAGGSCPAFEDDLGYHSVGCTYTGVGQRRRATSCTSATTGTTWNNPVTAFVTVDPGTYYRGTLPPPTKFY